jgi:hypothetical protein
MVNSFLRHPTKPVEAFDTSLLARYNLTNVDSVPPHSASALWVLDPVVASYRHAMACMQAMPSLGQFRPSEGIV